VSTPQALSRRSITLDTITPQVPKGIGDPGRMNPMQWFHFLFGSLQRQQLKLGLLTPAGYQVLLLTTLLSPPNARQDLDFLCRLLLLCLALLCSALPFRSPPLPNVKFHVYLYPAKQALRSQFLWLIAYARGQRLTLSHPTNAAETSQFLRIPTQVCALDSPRKAARGAVGSGVKRFNVI
jgi:hypothetical protein